MVYKWWDGEGEQPSAQAINQLRRERLMDNFGPSWGSQFPRTSHGQVIGHRDGPPITMPYPEGPMYRGRLGRFADAQGSNLECESWPAAAQRL